MSVKGDNGNTINKRGWNNSNLRDNASLENQQGEQQEKLLKLQHEFAQQASLRERKKGAIDRIPPLNSSDRLVDYLA